MDSLESTPPPAPSTQQHWVGPEMQSVTVEPIFIVGSYRSGTSIFCWCLGQHLNIVNIPETYWLARLSMNLEELYRLGTLNKELSHFGQAGVSKQEFYRLFGEGLQHLMQATNAALLEKLEGLDPKSEFRGRRAFAEPKRRWVDATPENSHYIYGLACLFPNARFIHILRNPHDVAKSLMNFSRVGSGKDYKQNSAYRAWLRLTHAAVNAEQALGRGRMIRVNYEDLISSPEVTFRTVLDFLGEPYDENCIKPLATKINSSKVDDTVTLRSTYYSRKAEKYYHGIRLSAVPPVSGDVGEYRLMEQKFFRDCRKLGPSLIRRLAVDAYKLLTGLPV